jgi:hypothetical protein
MRRTLVTMVTLVSAAAMMSGAGLALASNGPGISRHENFRIISTNEAAKRHSVIATGSFMAGGSEALGRTVSSRAVDQAYLYRGTFEITRQIRFRTPPAPPRRCILRVTERGTYTLSHGTGRYAGISGSGRFTSRETLVFARTGPNNCGKTIAFQQIMYESGTVSG